MRENHDSIHPDAVSVYPGIEASYHSFECTRMDFHHDAIPDVMEIRYCHYGRVGWELNDHTSVYMGEGDVTMHSTILCSDSSMHFPSGYYEGITINIDFKILQNHLPDLLKNTGIDIPRLRQTFCSTEKSITFTDDHELDQIFSALYHKPENQKFTYLKIKVIELLLYLDRSCQDAPESIAYNSDIIRTIQEIHALITGDLSARYTINDLSAQFLINTSTLKAAFKAVYGMPIATYMKEYRMQHAARLLRHTDAPLSEIAAQIGYGTQSKFTQAFKDCIGMLPSAYRKQSFSHS